ncbi:MAG: 3-oxoacyl-[acyl-carrier-protein] synthase III [Planctomycetota bacterium]|jgi:3-oxoacyl-[acyl-carrier-protein] synthase III
MRFQHVRIESLAHVLPDQVVSSEELEHQLAPAYGRLGLSVGRLELMTGIRERRFWPEGTRPSEASTKAGLLALERSGVPADRIGMLVHSAVCRDFLEPSTASVVHAQLGLTSQCMAFDLSNACIGFANAMTMAGALIEARQIDAALIVTGEDGGPLVRETIEMLNRGCENDRRALKRAQASLTIGSGAAAMVLAHESIATSSSELLGGTSRSATQHYALCSGDFAQVGHRPLMETDSDALLKAGCSLAHETFAAFLEEQELSTESIDRIVTHQVSTKHKRALLEALGLSAEIDFPTVETWGNVGSMSLPGTLSLAVEEGVVKSGQLVCLQGIGSGLHSQMLAVRW